MKKGTLQQGCQVCNGKKESRAILQLRREKIVIASAAKQSFPLTA
jgi:hypothetical protein